PGMPGTSWVKSHMTPAPVRPRSMSGAMVVVYGTMSPALGMSDGPMTIWAGASSAARHAAGRVKKRMGGSTFANISQSAEPAAEGATDGPYLRGMRIRILTAVVALCGAISAWAQTDDRQLVQFSGVVVTDRLSPVPFTNIMIKNTYRGTMSDVFGYFSFVAQEGDTILFSAVGFQRSQYVIPTDLTENRYSMIHAMARDTVLLSEFKVYPWPSREQFRDA